MEAVDKPAELVSETVEVVPVVVLSQTFPARPSSMPDIRDFVRRCLAQSPLSEQDTGQAGMACRPRRDRAGAWCGSGPGALRRHLDRAVR